MNITLEFGHIITLVGGAIGAYALLGRLLVAQFTKQVEAKFKQLDDKLAVSQNEWVRLDKELVAIRLLLAQEYVRFAALDKLELQIDANFRLVFEKLDSKAGKEELRQIVSKP